MCHDPCQLSYLAEEVFARSLVHCKMFSARKSVIVLALMSLSVPSFCAPRGTSLRQQVKDAVHPTSADSSLGEYERKTQSPMIWINLHKTDLSSSQSPEPSSFLQLRKQRGVTGDPSPPPYPVVNVHVSEPAMGADDFKLAATAHQHEQDSLLELEAHIASMEEQTLATMAALAQEVKHVGDMVDIQMQA